MRHPAHRDLLREGDMAPDLRLVWLDGGEVSLHALAAERPVLLAFFKISCPVCQMTLPFLERVYREHHIVGVSQDSAEGTREFNRYFGLTFPMVLDSEHEDFPASNAFGITHVPTMFLVEADGRIAKVIEGWEKKAIAELGALRPDDNVPAWKAG